MFGSFFFYKTIFLQKDKATRTFISVPKERIFLKKYFRLSIFINAYKIFNTGIQSKNTKGLH